MTNLTGRLVLALISSLPVLQAAQSIRIPDATLRGRLLALGIDANRDGIIQDTEAREIEILDLRNAGIIDATGLNGFTNLRILDLANNKLQRFDTSGLTKLEDLRIFDNQITELDLSKLKSLGKLDARFNKLTQLTVPDLPNLTLLSLTNNPGLASLRLGNLPNLQEFYIAITQLTAVDLRPFRKLERFEGFDSPLQKIEFGDNPSLMSILASNTSVEALNLRGLKALKTLSANKCQKLRQLNTAGAVSLELVELDDSGIVSADFTGSPRIREISMMRNPLVELQVRGLALLEKLECIDERRSYPSVRQLNLSGTVRLRVLNL